MIPDIDNTHVVEALKLLTDQYKEEPNIRAILSAAVNEIQQVETGAWSFINGVILDTGVGDVLDKYGEIVGVARNGLLDDAYRALIQLQIRVNLANGKAEDVIQTAALTLSSFLYGEWYPASFFVRSIDVLAPGGILSLLGRVKAAGTYGVFEYSTWPEATDIVWDSSTGALATARGFSDSVAGIPFNVMISAQELV